jgi:hypothetical protein
MTGRRTVPLALVGLCLSVTLACGIRPSSDSSLPSKPQEEISVDWIGSSGVEPMAVNSDLVLLGTVVTVEPGRKVGPGAEQIQYRDVTGEIERLALCRLSPPPVTAVVQELGWSNGKSVEPSDMPWSKKGDRGYFFLQKDVPGKFGYVGRQGRLLIDSGKVESVGLNAMTPVALAQQIDAAVAKIEAEDIPNPPGPAMGDGGR